MAEGASIRTDEGEKTRKSNAGDEIVYSLHSEPGVSISDDGTPGTLTPFGVYPSTNGAALHLFPGSSRF